MVWFPFGNSLLLEDIWRIHVFTGFFLKFSSLFVFRRVWKLYLIYSENRGYHDLTLIQPQLFVWSVNGTFHPLAFPNRCPFQLIFCLKKRNTDKQGWKQRENRSVWETLLVDADTLLYSPILPDHWHFCGHITPFWNYQTALTSIHTPEDNFITPVGYILLSLWCKYHSSL